MWKPRYDLAPSRGGVFIWGLGRLDAAKVAHTARLRLTTNAAFSRLCESRVPEVLDQIRWRGRTHSSTSAWRGASVIH
jgi:hypothetical protein